MATFERRDNKVLINGLQGAPMSFAEMQSAYDALCGALDRSVGRVEVDMNGAEATNHAMITFLIGCGDHCAAKGIPLSFINLSDDAVKESLLKLGFDEIGGYKCKEFRERKPRSMVATVGEGALKFVADTCKLAKFAVESAKAVAYLVRHPGKLDVREVLFYFDRSGVDAVPIVVLICLLVGMILGMQGLLQLGRFGLSPYIADLVSLIVVRELGPLMVAMICIGRAGSAYAAELGTMRVNEEIDAMDTMGLKPARFLVIPKLVALMAAMPLLVVIGNACGVVGGLLVSVCMTDLTAIEYWRRTVEALLPVDVLQSLIKAVVFAFIIAGVGCFRGMEADRDAKGVGNATTSSVVSGIFLVIVADFAITYIFPKVFS